MRKLRDDGIAIIYISHRMAEVNALADCVTVLRDGGYVGELIEATGQVTKAGKSLIFVRGQITTGERLLMTFSGVIRKFTPRG